MVKKWKIDPEYTYHHQKLTFSRASHLAHACHVWSTSVSAFVSYPAHRTTDRQTDRQTDRTITLLRQNSLKQHCSGVKQLADWQYAGSHARKVNTGN